MNVQSMGKVMNSTKVLIGKPDWLSHFQDLGMHEMIKLI
jgi:hypothetical protein